MPKPTQLPVQFPPDVLSQLRRLSTESGRSIAALVREAVDRYLNPAGAVLQPQALWSILRDPAHWLEFKRIAAEMEGQAAITAEPAVNPEPIAAAPAYRFKRAEGVAARAVAEEERPPF